MNTKNRSSRLVYSTELGRIKSDNTPAKQLPEGDGTLYIRRETKGRKGKGVTTISGLLVDDAERKKIAKQLKQLCSTGGSVKNGVIEIQGDHRETLKAKLTEMGFTVKLAGG